MFRQIQSWSKPDFGQDRMKLEEFERRLEPWQNVVPYEILGSTTIWINMVYLAGVFTHTHIYIYISIYTLKTYILYVYIYICVSLSLSPSFFLFLFFCIHGQYGQVFDSNSKAKGHDDYPGRLKPPSRFPPQLKSDSLGGVYWVNLLWILYGTLNMFTAW